MLVLGAGVEVVLMGSVGVGVRLKVSSLVVKLVLGGATLGATGLGASKMGELARALRELVVGVVRGSAPSCEFGGNAVVDGGGDCCFWPSVGFGAAFIGESSRIGMGLLDVLSVCCFFPSDGSSRDAGADPARPFVSGSVDLLLMEVSRAGCGVKGRCLSPSGESLRWIGADPARFSRSGSPNGANDGFGDA